MDPLTLILSIMVGYLVYNYLFRRKIGKFDEMGIPQVKPIPILGNMAPSLFRQMPFVEVIRRTYDVDDRADYVVFHDFGEPTIMIRSPELIKSIMIKNFDHFVDHRGFVDADQDPLFGKNLFSLRGEKWKEVRNLLSPAFTGSKMKSMFKLMSNCGKNFADFLAQRSIDEPHVIDSKEAFTRYTNDVIATCAFGIAIDSMRDPKNDFYVLGRKATNFEGFLSVKFFVLRSFPGLSKFFNLKLIDPIVERFFEGVVRQTIEMRDREGITRPDMLQLMMDARGKKIGESPELTIQDMTAQAFIFFFGGFDTSSSLMCFLAYIIAVNSEIQERLREDVDEIMRETNGEPTYEAINGMEYFDAVISETLRVYPIAGFLDRLCVKTFQLPPCLPGGKNVTLEPGDNVLFPAYALHLDPKYHSNPDEFDPERFMGNRKNDVDPFTYFPFGQGPRMCIGNRFALLETKVLFFHLLSRCHLRPSLKTLVPLKLSKSTFAMTAEGGFWIQLESRDVKTTNSRTNGVSKSS